VEVLHFPIRSFEQFERKVLNTGIGYELLRDRAPGIGVDQLELLNIQRQGRLRDYYNEQCADRSEPQQLLDGRELLVDDRLQAFLAAKPSRLEESPSAQEVLRRAWLTAEDRQDASTRRIAELSAELTAAHKSIAELVETLETIRSSHIMRMTEPARRLYYRVRPGG
jgi:hypothetical protein